MRRILSILAGMVVIVAQAAPKLSPIVSEHNGRLVYDQDAKGNRVPDFSSCGYAGGGVAIPNVPVQIVVAPKNGDSTERIQRAINYVASLPQDTNGFRGAVLLLKGRHEILGGLTITNSDVVLRGQGMDENGTVIVAAGLDRRTAIHVRGRQDRDVTTNSDWKIVDEYVPVGATSFHVSNATGLKPGDLIRVVRPSTAAWIDLLDADEFGGGIGGGWKPGSRDVVWERAIQSIDGNAVTVDAPITTALESNLGGGCIETFSWDGRIMNVGIENLRLESTFDQSNSKDENHSWFGITLENARDAWVRQVTFKHFAGSAVAIYESGSRVTVQDCLSLTPISEEGGYRRNTFFTMGQQTLFLRCFAENGMHDFSVGHCAAGPNAFVQCEARLPLRDSGSIESWSSGVLYDNVVIDGNALTLGFRPGSGRAVGWAAANSVLWNCSASVIRCENPPGAQNWAFGCWSEFSGNGIWRGANDFVSPDSLYAAQLRDRSGDVAADRLQLMSRSHEESSNPSIEKAQELADASHRPAPLLKHYIADACRRDPIPSDAGTARHVEDIPRLKTEVPFPKRALVITNGWLTCDGKLLIGDSTSVAWWRGSIRPGEADDFGLGITRFVPGRIGAGFTDDLNGVADSLGASGQVALDHSYGLWYDRRRDDHERIRRIDGDVRPPFYEQPFARRGQGTAWDGLSKYDLTKFNPWYWSRLKQFADICDERALVLFHENYFQHNIIEAGAHWVDSPWRSANNINNTGFPEPPPFAGDKRIFQAELFYDVTHPVRRKLHEAYIRQCLENFKTNSNVIQFTSAEFTGPLHFVEFWLDTIAKWERENKRSKPIIALAAPKNVQDSILADRKRAAVVDVIAFRYWWLTDKGLYAPEGGKNLSPRQFDRLLHGGTPSDQNLATMAAEYRAKFPSKPVIAASEQGNDLSRCGWAYLCAGGSMPNLPRSADAKLLAAIPRMKPWFADNAKKIYALREAGKQILIYGDGDLDLSGETGAFRLNTVNQVTGKITAGELVQAGGKIKSPATVVWLIKE